MNSVRHFSNPVRSADGRVSPLPGVAISLRSSRCAAVKVRTSKSLALSIHRVDGETVERFAGLPVVRRLTDLNKVHAVVVTDIQNAQRVFDKLTKAIPPERVLTAPLLKVSRTPPVLTDD